MENPFNETYFKSGDGMLTSVGVRVYGILYILEVLINPVNP